MKKLLKSVFVVIALASTVAGATYAAWTAQAKVLSNTFSTGNASLKLYGNLGGTPGENANLKTELNSGVNFSNVYPGWEDYYTAKVYNSGTVNLSLVLDAVLQSETVDLEQYIEVAVYEWLGSDGHFDPATERGPAYEGWKTLKEWRKTGGEIDLGQIDAGATTAVAIRFRAMAGLPNSYQNQNTVFDFIFDGTTEGATQ